MESQSRSSEANSSSTDVLGYQSKLDEPRTLLGQFQSRGGDLPIAFLLIFFAGLLLYDVGTWIYYRGWTRRACLIIPAAVAVATVLLAIAWNRLIAFGKWADEAKKKWQKPQETKQ